MQVKTYSTDHGKVNSPVRGGIPVPRDKKFIPRDKFSVLRDEFSLHVIKITSM